MKIFALILLSVFVVGCISVPEKRPPGTKLKLAHYFKHPVHGEVELPSDIYMNDKKECKEKVYSSGVSIDGEVTKDEGKINSYQNEYTLWSVKAMLRNSAACGSSGMSSLACKAKKPAVIGKYIEAERVEKAVSECMKKSGWKRSRTEKTYVPIVPPKS